jgi:hypothetical protein
LQRHEYTKRNTSLRIVTLNDKPEQRQRLVDVAYFGPFQSADRASVGL